MKRLAFVLIPFLIALLVFTGLILVLTRNKDKGALQITSSPNSQVYLDGKLIGESPLCKCELKDMISEGVHNIKLVPLKGDFSPFEQKISISPKVLTVVDKTFAQKGLESGSVISLSSIEDKKDAQISVVSFPQGAQVYLDNTLSGQSPLLLKKITESDHELKLTKTGYKDKIVRIRTVLGYRLEALIFLGINPNIASQSKAPISSQSATQQIIILTTPVGFLRVRSEASASSKEIGQVKPGETYEFVSEKEGWFQIKLNNGQVGWITSKYAEKKG
jgi:hypothetical protein